MPSAGGKMTRKHMYLTAQCAGEGCENCATELVIDGNSSELRHYNGLYTWNSQWSYVFDAERHACR
jgi:hypothetical protein